MSSHATTLKPAANPGTGFNIKQGVWLAARLAGAFLAMLIAFLVSSAVVDTSVASVPADSAEAAPALLLVSLITSLVLAYPILRSRWHGLKLMAAVLVVMFGVQTFMSQIETLFFINALTLSFDLVMRIIAAGFVRALVFAPLAVIVLGKLLGPSLDEPTTRLQLPLTEWIKRFAILSLVYVVVYFGFGYFVAYQWAAVRDYYAGTFDPGLVLPLFQVLRGAVWAALALPIVAMMRGKAWETCLALGLVFAGLLAAPLLFPNPFMPPMVRQGHLVELTTSMLTYGAIAGWVWTRSWGMKQTRG